MGEASEVSRRAAEVRIAMHRDGDGPRYTYEAFAVSDAWEGTIKADNTESAIHEALCDCWRRRPKLSKRPVKVVVSVPFGKISPQYLPELEALHPGLSLTLHKGSVSDLVSDIPKSSVRKRWTTTEPNLAPVIVATDGSVRGGITGWGWLTSTGDFNMTGFRHSRDQMGADIPLVAELRAIDDAIRGLSQHRSINIISDSRNAVTMVAEWMRGSTLLPAGYNADGRKKGKVAGLVAARNRIHRDRDRISISWDGTWTEFCAVGGCSPVRHVVWALDGRHARQRYGQWADPAADAANGGWSTQPGSNRSRADAHGRGSCGRDGSCRVLGSKCGIRAHSAISWRS